MLKRVVGIGLLLCLATSAARADDPVLKVVKARRTDGALAWFKRGVALARNGEYGAAINRLNRARSLAPNWALPYLEIAVAHLMTDNDRDAIGSNLAKAVKLDPSIPRAHYLLGVFLQEAKKRTQAMRELVAALKLRPSLTDARYRLAMLYVEEGRQPRGVEQFEAVLKQEPSHLGARRNLTVLYEQSGRLEPAEKHLLAIARMFPNNAYYLNNLARFYERNGWAAKAQKAQKRAQKLQPRKRKRRMRPLLPSRR